jgi:hypothetical protein
MVRGSFRCGVASSSPIVCAVRTPVLILRHLVDIATDERQAVPGWVPGSHHPASRHVIPTTLTPSTHYAQVSVTL